MCVCVCVFARTYSFKHTGLLSIFALFVFVWLRRVFAAAHCFTLREMTAMVLLESSCLCYLLRRVALRWIWSSEMRVLCFRVQRPHLDSCCLCRRYSWYHPQRLKAFSSVRQFGKLLRVSY